MALSSGFPEKKFRDTLFGPPDSTGMPVNFARHSIIQKIQQIDGSYRSSSLKPEPQLPCITLDCGDDDFLLFSNLDLAKLLKTKNIPFELRIRDGGHTWEYWRTALALALEFNGNVLRN